jgi:hypothetical protein
MKTSDTIARFAASVSGHDVALSMVAEALQDRGLSLLIILFALPNVVIPGLSFILGAPVLLFALQIATGRSTVWLPPFLARRTLSDALFQRAASYAGTSLRPIERRVRRRWVRLVSGRFERLLGFYIAFVAVFLMSPVPFGNALPALGITLISIGLIEKDGKAAAFGAVLGLLGCAYIAAVIFFGVRALNTIFSFL